MKWPIWRIWVIYSSRIASAGRIPSESGFRYYVDCMMERENLVDDEVQLLQKIIKENLQDWDEVIQSIGNFLAQVTRYTSFVIVPTVRVDEFKYVQLVLMGKGKAMVILVTDTGVLMPQEYSRVGGAERPAEYK